MFNQTTLSEYVTPTSSLTFTYKRKKQNSLVLHFFFFYSVLHISFKMLMWRLISNDMVGDEL